MRHVAIQLAGISMALFAPMAIGAQQPGGRIIGTVVDRTTGRPVSAAQVWIPGSAIGTITDARGQFVLANVPAGSHEVRVQNIGYRTVSDQVTLAAGETVTLAFELVEEALPLDAIVVTGTAGQARRREVGNSIAQINLAQGEPAAVDLDQMLQGKVAGLTVLESGAQVGSGRQIRLRGNVSVAMSNQPLIYVDGVRIRSDMLPQNMLFADADATGMRTSSGAGTGTVASPLNSINPEDIERIEVIKGAAATTLYGTEAASGVIQIFTKRGRAGKAAWTAVMEQGFSQLMQAFGTAEKPFLGLDPWMKRGWLQSYSLSVNGGTEDVGYYVSAAYADNDGIFPDDWEKSYTLRGNFNFRPSPNLFIDWNTSVNSKSIQNVPMGNNAEGLTLNVYRSPVNYIGSDKKEDIDRLFEQEWLTYIDHLVTGVTVRHQTLDNLSNRLTIGYDRLDSELIGTFPYGFITDEGGLRTDRRWLNETLTLDYVGTLSTRFGEDVTSTFSLGAQSVTTATSSLWGHAEDFPGPGLPTLSSGANRLSFEDRQRVINAGVFGQALIGYRDRYFLTVGMRADGNSAFGENLGLKLYPKVSASYVISDEDFFPEPLGEWKLRAAYGHAGRAPGAFDAVRTWRPVGWAGEPAFLPNTVGNPNLGPERTAELELGFDAVMLDQRLSIEFTYYRATTTDALLPVVQIPTLGFLGTQLENVGTIENRGFEATANATLIGRESFSWRLGLNVSHNRNEVTDLGASTPFSLGETGWVMEGQPVGVIVGTRLKNPDAYAEPELEPDYKFGPNSPPTTIGVSTELLLPLGLELSAQAEYMGGHYIFDRASRNMASRGVWAPCQGSDGGYAKLAQGRRDEMTAFERLACDSRATPRDFMNFPGDFLKLRHISLSAPIPASLLGPARSATLSLSVRNLRLWKHPDLRIFDPEMAGASGAASPVRAIVENVPSPTAVMTSLRISF